MYSFCFQIPSVTPMYIFFCYLLFLHWLDILYSCVGNCHLRDIYALLCSYRWDLLFIFSIVLFYYLYHYIKNQPQLHWENDQANVKTEDNEEKYIKKKMEIIISTYSIAVSYFQFVVLFYFATHNATMTNIYRWATWSDDSIQAWKNKMLPFGVEISVCTSYIYIWSILNIKHSHPINSIPFYLFIYHRQRKFN